MKRFYVGIKGVLVKDRRVLLVKASKLLDGKDHWEVPGGRINDNESIEQTLRRELTEEILNLQDVNVHELLHITRLQKDVVDTISLVLVFYRISGVITGEPVLSEEHREFKWATEEEALRLVQPETTEAIKQAFEYAG